MPRNYKSPINCKKQGLDSEGLVYCNLYGAYSNVPVGKNAQTSSFGSYLNLNEEQCEIPEYSYALVQYNHSPVQNQGREGACTAYGLIHALEATIQSVSPDTHISAQKLWDEYRSPYTNAAYSAATRGFNGSGVLTANNGVQVRVRGETRLRTIEDIKKAIACKGLGVKVASNVNNSWFQSSRGGDSVNCDSASSGAGHAYSFVGYDDTVSPPVFIIKNSWGSGWKSDGYATIDQSCWNSSTYAGSAEVMDYEIVGN
jgi:C1A family cysteine protease